MKPFETSLLSSTAPVEIRTAPSLFVAWKITTSLILQPTKVHQNTATAPSPSVAEPKYCWESQRMLACFIRKNWALPWREFCNWTTSPWLLLCFEPPTSTNWRRLVPAHCQAPGVEEFVHYQVADITNPHRRHSGGRRSWLQLWSVCSVSCHRALFSPGKGREKRQRGCLKDIWVGFLGNHFDLLHSTVSVSFVVTASINPDKFTCRSSPI